MHHIFRLFVSALFGTVTFLFVLGGIGCVIVLLMTFWEDLKTIAGR